MTAIIDALFDKALELSANVPDNFMELGRALAQLHDLDRDRFRQLVAKSNMGLRRAYHLIEVSRTVEARAIPRDQLGKIGWPKLQLIVKHLTPNTLDALLRLADESTVEDLKHRLPGWKRPAGNAHCMLRYFSPKSYEQLEGALMSKGGTPSAGVVK
jgi:hypothetical protein